MDNDDQITALAREYAEEIYPNLSDKIISLRTQEIKNAERLIRFLLRRFCIVEKGKVNEMYKAAMEVSRLPKSVEARGYAISRLQTLESLFPDLGKEVEE